MVVFPHIPLVVIVTPPAGGSGENVGAELVLVLEAVTLELELELELEIELELVLVGEGVVTGTLVDVGSG